MKKYPVNRCGQCRHRSKMNNLDYCRRRNVCNPPLCREEMQYCDIYKQGYEIVATCATCLEHKVFQLGEKKPFDNFFREMLNESPRKLRVDWTKEDHWCEILQKIFRWTPQYPDDSDAFFPKECPLEDITSEELAKRFNV